MTTTNGEYVALGVGVKETFFPGTVLYFFPPELRGSHVQEVYNNQVAIALAENPGSATWIKHVDVGSHFVGGIMIIRSKNVRVKFAALRKASMQVY